MEEINAKNQLIEMEKFSKLFEWLTDHGADYSKLELIFYTADYRGIVAKEDIKADDIVLSVPIDICVTVERA